MENNPLHFLKEKERLELLYDLKLQYLERETSYLIDDEAVQLYLLLQKEKAQTNKDKKAALNKQLKQHQNRCTHPIYVCLNTDNNSDVQEYDCMCLNCGSHIEIPRDEVERLYNNHKMIAIEKLNLSIYDGEIYSYYIFSPEFSNAREFYLNLYGNIDALLKEANDENIPVDEYICEKTFTHFVHPKTYTKPIQKTLK